MSFTIDTLEWNIPCSVERVAEMESSEISGMLLDKSYFNDVIGTYMRYSIRLEVPFGYEQQYSSLYDVLTAPVDGHEFILPYAGGTITVTGRIQNVKDVYVRMRGGAVHWKGVAFDILSNHPSRTLSLGEAITRGTAALPAEGANVGSVYEYTSEGWDTVDSANDYYY